MMSGKTTLLLADDDPAVTDSLAPFLERAGSTFWSWQTGTARWKKWLRCAPICFYWMC